MTYRDRRAARADRLRDWADRRVATASATLAADDALPYAHDIAFLTQPGRIAARTRMNARADRAYASLQKADSMAAKADNIDRAAARVIYSDDPDAADRLRAKVADLEAQRASIVAYNKACRKAGRVTDTALALLGDYWTGQVAQLARIGFLRPDGSLPGYATSNLSGNISRLRARLAGI